jgi:protein-tyrosine phosphatase
MRSPGEVMSEPLVAVCFVCLGNICRSPTAEGVFLELVKEAGWGRQIRVDSAGTGGWHVGEPADRRSAATARERGVGLPSRSRQLVVGDFALFDYLLAMDRENLENMRVMAPQAQARSRVHLFRDFDTASPKGSDVPDPYYGGPRGFDDVYDMCEASARGLLKELTEKFKLS